MHEHPSNIVIKWTSEWAQSQSLKTSVFNEIESTNTYAKSDQNPSTCPLVEPSEIQILKPTMAGPSVYLAQTQSAGRGRGSNQWLSPKSGGFLSSWSFCLAKVPQPILAPLVGLALCEAAIATWPHVAFNLKAPNDLYIGGQKVAGLLIEIIDQSPQIRVIIGLGFNVFGGPEEIATATGLQNHLPSKLSKDEWQAFLQEWSNRLQNSLKAGQMSRLTSDAAQRLLPIMNRHPNLKEPILRIDDFAQLHFASHTVHWHEL